MKMSAYTIPLRIEKDQYLLINLLTGAVTLVDQRTVELLQKGSSDELRADPTTEVLREAGHLTVLSCEEEMEEISHTYETYVQTHRRMYTHMVIPTYDCNLACSYCPLSDFRCHSDTPYNTVIDDNHIDALFAATSHVDKDYKGQVILSGGEPLLVENKPVIERILHKGTQYGYDITVATTGLSVPDFVDILQKYSAALEIPVDGPKDVHNSRRVKKDGTGTFEEVVTGIDTALDAGLTVFLRVNLDEGNIQVFPQMMDFFRKKGWYQNPGLFLHLSPVFCNPCKRNEPFTLRKTFYHDFIFHMVQRPEDTAPFLHIRGIEMIGNVFLKGELGPPRFWYCEANSGVLIYEPSGDIHACYGYMGDESTKIGQYYPELSWNESYNYWKQRVVFTIPACKKCTYALLCGGGCGFEALHTDGTLPTPVCPDFQELTKKIPQLYTVMKDLQPK